MKFKIGDTVNVELKTTDSLLPLGTKFKATVEDIFEDDRVCVSDKDDYLFVVRRAEINGGRADRLTPFQQIQIIAENQNCVLEKENRGYSLVSNITFTIGDFANLGEVLDALESDPSFN